MTTILSGTGPTITENKTLLPLTEVCDRCPQHANVVVTMSGGLALQFCRHHYNHAGAPLREQAVAVVLHSVRAD